MNDWIYVIAVVSGLSLAGVAGILIRLGIYINKLNMLEKKENECPIDDVRTKVTILDTKMSMFMRSMSINIADTLREHNKFELDALMDKLGKDVVTKEELHRLSTLLRNDFIETKDDTTYIKTHRLALANLMAIVDTKLIDSDEVANELNR
jgi:hypothetical protein